jgi:hypothetical protein
MKLIKNDKLKKKTKKVNFNIYTFRLLKKVLYFSYLKDN